MSTVVAGDPQALEALSGASRTARERIAALGRRYHALGWMLGTSGNLSARFQREGERPAVVITASSCDKGSLGPEDFVELLTDGTVAAAGAGRRPSAETSIHLAIYATLPDVGAVLHVHTPASTLLCPREGLTAGSSPATLRFEGLEMLKGWGFWEEGATADLPIFPNHSDVGALAGELAGWLRGREARAIEQAPALVIGGHGLTAWGASLEEAHRHVEITEFFCRLERA